MLALWLGLAARLTTAAAAAEAAGDLYPQRSTAPIVIISPAEGQSMPLSEGEFILGSVSDPSAPFVINGATVSVRANGAFLAWLPISPGTFAFHCSLALKSGTTSFVRTINVTVPPPLIPAKPLAIDPESVWPKADVGLRPGDWLSFHLRGSPGQKARCRLGDRPWVDLRELAAGNYDTQQMVVPGQSAGPAAVTCRLGSGWSSVQATSRGQASVTSGPPSVAVVKNNAVLRTAPGAGYMVFPLPGTRLAVTGRQGGELRVSLSPSLEGWIDAKDADLLPVGAAPPRAEVDAIHSSASDHASLLRVSLSERVAFAVEEGEDLSSLTLRLFNCSGHVNWIIYDSKDAFVEDVRWRQEATGVVAITVRLKPEATLWGYQASYEGNSLKLELRRPPMLAAEPASPLKGLTVVLDPGHMPSAPGAIGPLGTREMDANFAIAKAAAAALSKRGAVPVLTRSGPNDEVGLPDRPRLALERKGDLFVSLHNNALSDGENPFARPRGYSVFYYHPHSLALARQMYRSYERHSPLSGEELRYGNLLVARLSAMPAILVENAYMIVPSQEEKLNDPAFRGVLAEAVADGLESFLGAERAKQQGRTAGHSSRAQAPAAPRAEKHVRKKRQP